jgi:hypothetical protein
MSGANIHDLHQDVEVAKVEVVVVQGVVVETRMKNVSYVIAKYLPRLHQIPCNGG